jgi:hypothetical protein
LPESASKGITNYRAQNNADFVMYHQELARAAEQRGWQVHWYETKKVLREATKAMGKKESVEIPLKQTGQTLGPCGKEPQNSHGHRNRGVLNDSP